MNKKVLVTPNHLLILLDGELSEIEDLRNSVVQKMTKRYNV